MPGIHWSTLTRPAVVRSALMTPRPLRGERGQSSESIRIAHCCSQISPTPPRHSRRSGLKERLAGAANAPYARSMETHASVLRRALGWCGNLAGWFPMLRPGPKALSLAEDIAAGLGPNDGMVLPVHVQAVRALIDDRERQRLVDLFVAEQADEWAAVCSDARDVDALETALVEGVARVSILERRLPPGKRLVDLETGRAPQTSSIDVLVVTLPAQAVWSIVDAQAADARLAKASSPLARVASARAVARERGSAGNVQRVQTLARTLARQLPEPRYPRASALLVKAYRLAEQDPALAWEVAENLLGVYVVERASYSSSGN